MSFELPVAPKRIGTAIIASLAHLFPTCWQQTARQGIEPFSCIDPKREGGKMCDFVNECPWAKGLTQNTLRFDGARMFVGYGDDFVVVWWKALPSFTNMKQKVDVTKFFESLANESSPPS